MTACKSSWSARGTDTCHWLEYPWLSSSKRRPFCGVVNTHNRKLIANIPRSCADAQYPQRRSQHTLLSTVVEHLVCIVRTLITLPLTRKQTDHPSLHHQSLRYPHGSRPHRPQSPCLRTSLEARISPSSRPQGLKQATPKPLPRRPSYRSITGPLCRQRTRFRRARLL